MVETYDIEVLINFFSFYSINIKEISLHYKYIIHESQNDLLLLIEHLKKVKGQVGFNNLAYDAQIIDFILKEYKNWLNLNGEEISHLIYQYSQFIIEKGHNNEFPPIPWWKLIIPQCDLYKIWHFDNKNKRTSLKWVEYSMDFHSIEEMPIKHNEYVTKEGIEDIISYNRNDVLATLEFYNITIGNTNHVLYRGVDKLQLRRDIKKEFNFICTNYNDVKIGDKLNKINYCKFKGINDKNLPKPNKEIKPFTFGDCFPSYYKFTSLEFNNFVNSLKNIKVDLEKKKVKNKEQAYSFTYNGTTYLMAKGGLHSIDNPRKVIPEPHEILIDADVGSMYPNAISKRRLFPAHLGEEWLSGYQDIIEKRIMAKKAGKQAINEAFKLALNGGSFGKTNEEFNWQYDPKVTYSVTIGSQIDLLMLIEKLETNGIHVISANTDGIVALFNRDKLDLYYKLCKEWEIKVGNNTNGNLEYSEYSYLVQTSVNDYLALSKSGKVKTKGDFVSDFEIHKDKSARVIPLALQEYFLKGTSIKEFIRNHTNIFDFCCGIKPGVKSQRGTKFISLDKKGNEVELQKVNRYYISNKGVHILKRLPKLENKKLTNQLDIFGNVNDGTRESEVEAGWLSTIYNRHTPKDIKEYDINYKYYITKTQEIIDKIE